MAPAPTDHVTAETLAGLQGADPCIKLGSQPRTWGLQNSIGTLYFPHQSLELLAPAGRHGETISTIQLFHSREGKYITLISRNIKF